MKMKSLGLRSVDSHKLKSRKLPPTIQPSPCDKPRDMPQSGETSERDNDEDVSVHGAGHEISDHLSRECKRTELSTRTS
jgi:hypothetical protein